MVVGLPITQAQAAADFNVQPLTHASHTLMRQQLEVLGGDGVLGKEAREKHLQKVLTQHGNGALGRQVAAIDMVDPTDLVIRGHEALDNLFLAAIHRCS